MEGGNIDIEYEVHKCAWGATREIIQNYHAYTHAFPLTYTYETELIHILYWKPNTYNWNAVT